MPTKLPHQSGYPGDGYYYVLCDVCGKKMRAKDAIKINDRFNYLNGLVVCQEDADETNPQNYIKARRERVIDDPGMIRSEAEDNFVFISDVDEIEGGDSSDPTGTSPGVPRYLTVINVTDSEITLQWLGPELPGSGAISGYKIERESPVGGGFSDLVVDTGSVALCYTDASVASGTQYNYRVSAISRIGTGNPSNEANATTD